MNDLAGAGAEIGAAGKALVKEGELEAWTKLLGAEAATM
jgi:hypothetical protein